MSIDFDLLWFDPADMGNDDIDMSPDDIVVGPPEEWY